MNLGIKLIIFSILGLTCVTLISFPQVIGLNWITYFSGHLVACASLCLMAVSVKGFLKARGLKSRTASISSGVFMAFLAVYFLAYALNPIETPFNPQQIDFEIFGTISFLMCLAVVWTGYRVGQSFKVTETASPN